MKTLEFHTALVAKSFAIRFESCLGLVARRLLSVATSTTCRQHAKVNYFRNADHPGAILTSHCTTISSGMLARTTASRTFSAGHRYRSSLDGSPPRWLRYSTTLASSARPESAPGPRRQQQNGPPLPGLPRRREAAMPWETRHGYFFKPAVQFKTTVIGSGPACPSEEFTRNRFPSGEGE